MTRRHLAVTAALATALAILGATPGQATPAPGATSARPAVQQSEHRTAAASSTPAAVPSRPARPNRTKWADTAPLGSVLLSAGERQAMVAVQRVARRSVRVAAVLGDVSPGRHQVVIDSARGARLLTLDLTAGADGIATYSGTKQAAAPVPERVVVRVKWSMSELDADSSGMRLRPGGTLVGPHGGSGPDGILVARPAGDAGHRIAVRARFVRLAGRFDGGSGVLGLSRTAPVGSVRPLSSTVPVTPDAFGLAAIDGGTMTLLDGIPARLVNTLGVYDVPRAGTWLPVLTVRGSATSDGLVWADDWLSPV